MTYRVAIDDVVLSFSNRIHSHKTGWARMQRCMIEDKCRADPHAGDDEVRLLFSGERAQVVDARTWMVSHDMAFNGETYNLFGGWSNDIRESLVYFIDHPNVLSLERSMPNLEAALRKRAEVTKSNLTDVEWELVSARCRSTPVMSHDQLVSGDTVVLGDSHAVAHYMRDRLVLRNDGLTLHRLVEDGVKGWLEGRTCKHLIIVAGNIDLRHHLLRQDDPSQAVRTLYAGLSRQLEEMYAKNEIDDFQVVMPYPIEFEGRRIPKTGYYRGTPFYGSSLRRRQYLEFMLQVAIAVFGAENVFEWPAKWYEIDAEEYASIYMERPQSVHLSPAWHRWDYVNNQPNEALIREYY